MFFFFFQFATSEFRRYPKPTVVRKGLITLANKKKKNYYRNQKQSDFTKRELWQYLIGENILTQESQSQQDASGRPYVPRRHEEDR